jgi:ATP-dependent Clp protease ATP-binding subunit ClpA
MYQTLNLSEESKNAIHIAEAYRIENMNEAIMPAHLLKALLHKDVGLIDLLESINKDYYYLLDWANVRIDMLPKLSKPNSESSFSKETEAVFTEAENLRLKMNGDKIVPSNLLATLTMPGVGFTYEQLKSLPLTTDELLLYMQTTTNGAAGQVLHTATPPLYNKGETKNLCKYTINCRTDATKQASIIIGFEKELRIIFEILGKKTKSNVLIKGASGIGKTTLINVLMQRITKGECPDLLKNVAVYELDLSAVSSEANYKGEIDDRIKKVLTELHGFGNAILIIEGIDKIFDKQSQLYGISTLLKKELERNHIRLIATTSVEGFTKNIEHDKEFTSKIEKLELAEPDFDTALRILNGAKQQYEEHHGLAIPDEVLPEAIRLSKRYMGDRCLPDSAFDLLDKTLSHIRYANDIPEKELEDKAKRTTIENSDLSHVIAQQTGIPIGKLQSGERDKLLNAENILKERVVGQDHAIKAVLDAIYESRAGLNKKGKPIACVFFLGPTGTGKTELTKALAEFLFQDESAIIRFDMTEFMESHSVAAMTGAPAGYVGYEEGGLLINKIRQKPYSIVLFDEIEKAHPDVFNIFFPIMDEGWLHDKLDRIGDFSNALIIFTSNAGSDYIFNAYQNGQIPAYENLKREMIKHNFPDAFLGRLTEIIPFSPISEEIVIQIFDIHFKNFLKTIKEMNINLTISDETKKQLALSEFSPQLGARPILGIIRNQIRRPLSKLIIEGKIKAGDNVEMVYDKDKYEFVTK